MLSYLDILGYFFILCILGLCLYVYFSTDDFQLKCIVSGLDGNKYCVRERNKLQEAADLLATTINKLTEETLQDALNSAHASIEL